MRVGILGGGQLGRMIALAGYPLGIECRCFDPSPDAPAGQVCDLVTAPYDDLSALDMFLTGLDVVTYEFENVPVEATQYIETRTSVFPPVGALQVAQDRLSEKEFFHSNGLPVPAFFAVDSFDDLNLAVEQTGLPAVLKTRRLGYDGKGQVVLHDKKDLADAWNQLGPAPLILEAFIPFDRELSVVAVRSQHGEIAMYPLVENYHREGILRRSIAPASGVSDVIATQSDRIASTTLNSLDYVGTLAIELFQQGDTLLINEMAPRVHNSGHWTIEGAETSQFENHLRAVAGLPLGSTRMRGHAAMLNFIGSMPSADAILEVAGAHLHLYGKAARPGRKLGHVTARTDSADELASTLKTLETIVQATG